jgi:small subunit ribosomal protein S17
MAEETKSLETARGPRKQRHGQVISNKMAKTIVVRVERRFPHPRFRKVVKAYKKFYAHDEKGDAKPGDWVRIEETRPLSKTKRWRLLEVVERNQLAMASAAPAAE